MSEFTPGDGWRLLGPDESVDGFGDEHKTSYGVWVKVPSYFTLWKAKDFIAVRRRIPAKPERLVLREVTASICHRKKKPEEWKVVAAIDATFPGTGYVDAAEARQLAAWLTRYAVWREAQDAAK
jgi:hypothetical protein